MSSHTRKIGDVAKVKGGKRLPKGMSVLDEATEHPYLRVVDFGDGGIDRSGIKYIDNETFDCIKRYTIDSSDVYISIAGTIGRVGVVPDDLSGANLTENAAKITEISDDVDHRYLMYYLRGPVGQGAIKNRTGGTSQPKLALYKIADIDFPYRPLVTQRRIASILSTYDNLIENNRRRIQLLEQSARLLYKEWFVHLRFPGHEHVKIKGGVPEGWECLRLGDIAHTNEESYKAKSLPAEINYIDISSVKQGRILTKTTMLSSEAPGRARRKAKDGDVIWSNVRPNLRAYALVLEPEDMDVFSTGFTILSSRKIPFSWLYLFTTTDSFVGHLVNHATGAGYPAVRPDDFERAEVVVPPKALLSLFHESIEPNFRQILKLEQQNQCLVKARDLLLPKLMNGELTP